MTIVEFFNPYDIKHVKAYDYLCTHGDWPEDFLILIDNLKIELIPNWKALLSNEIAYCWTQYMIYRGQYE